MKIAFVWINNYKKLKNFQTNFTSKYNIKFKSNNLDIDKNNQYIENFFKVNGSEIKLEISAIVGENGTGKSSILDFIQNYMEKVEFNTDFIIVFEVNNELVIDTNLEIKVTNKENYNIRISNNNANFNFYDNYLLDHITLFFSNVFDVRYLENEKKSFIADETVTLNARNISTNALLNNFDGPDAFLNSEFKKQIFFMNAFKEKLQITDIIDIPEDIYLETNNFSDELDTLSYELSDFIEEFNYEKVSNLYFDIGLRNNFGEKFTVRILQRYCIDVAYLLKGNGLKDTLIISAFNKGKKSNDVITMITSTLIKHFEKKSKLSVKGKIMKKLNDIQENYLKLIVAFNELELFENEKGIYILTTHKKTEAFLNVYKSGFYNSNLFYFYWSKLSSGQYSLLNLFGRFYDSLLQIERDFEDSLYDEEAEELNYEVKSYLLLIDEGDLYFHPQWQKDWLFYFIKLLELIFKGEVQVILTTHSPLILTDFPNCNVTFISESKAITINNELEGSVRTFGANINELFTNSFFISDGLIGKFAKYKINDFAKKLLNSEPDEVYREREFYKNFIDIIGEPFVKNKLLHIYNEKMNLSSTFNIEDRIRFLEVEILKLKSENK
ncbi:AAA family ATPase [Sporosarcina newyorkensis]|uniref:AAA domain-containing protein, putative AbiEii toxin, Type IV TA system n=1 Tax=Sporosarcina newyorkensis TaxID=759851 RepID=A0A1T4YHQ1_9BACL|nr:AAA family ATPase [Sporosarcina newyorkensis]SKB01316.1 AAA domain-containing protein, putative AbiEii toxin, Type IV TA system [Sporosarcina newyorkensis]